MAVEPLTDQEIQGRLEQLPGWSFADDRLTRTYVFKGHPQAAGLVAEVATIQEELDHHSDLTLGYNKVAVSVNTHSVGGKVTALDFDLAARIEAIAPQHGARTD
ncbi:4a-hydroxytetrahydrobiopterin dehydratase [Streptomyces sp. NPDC044780]|uniref:Putative pterin-4-alpha-carbinolamine dehydratase n=1 Tax=Streptomyces luomodiensis TaxID=3026192 RepID=A0ABY9V429_9ACTN|nr:4a-hydroxytetrahydrobiopterin dehydratase [Streptomyces sp. SCA4-21]WNE99627.1 4a-hydroxytetrahydrobiopterin dehydratase [Streptomyces sp. SCA4-21]